MGKLGSSCKLLPLLNCLTTTMYFTFLAQEFHKQLEEVLVLEMQRQREDGGRWRGSTEGRMVMVMVMVMVMLMVMVTIYDCNLGILVVTFANMVIT